MEATVNVNVRVSLEEATFQKIAQLLGGRPAGVEARPAMGPRPAVPEKPAESPKPESAPAPEAPAAEAPIDNMVLMNATKAAKDRGQADAIRALFAKYGIASSRECPQDKRKALLSDLNAL
jgi:hypothetical protein